MSSREHSQDEFRAQIAEMEDLLTQADRVLEEGHQLFADYGLTPESFFELLTSGRLRHKAIDQGADELSKLLATWKQEDELHELHAEAQTTTSRVHKPLGRGYV